MGSPDIMTDLPSPDLSLPDLASLRAEIDSIDDAVHDLLMRRAALSARMAASRVKNGGFPYRPGREAGILRRLDAHEVPIYAMTADVFDAAIRKCTEAGMNGHIGKPVNSQELYQKLYQALHKD